ncbi:unnamed protein product [Victoria cruziana]
MKLEHLTVLAAILTVLVPAAADNRGRLAISVVGSVFCDSCLQKTFSKHSYFLPGADVYIECSLKLALQSTRTVAYSVTRKTNRYGTYRLELPFTEGYNCRNGYQKESFCKATLRKSHASACSVEGVVNTTREMYIRSGRRNSCILSMKPLNYRPPTADLSICKNERPESVNNSKFLWPWFPTFPFPFFPPLPPMPQLPPFPFFPPSPFPPLPFTGPPSLPFPFPFSPPTPSWPHLPPIPSLFSPPPPPPAFSLGDPPSWFPFWHPPSPPLLQAQRQP